MNQALVDIANWQGQEAVTVKLSVSEYGADAFAIINGQRVMASPAVPLVQQSALSFTTHVESAAFAAGTEFVRLCADTSCLVAFGTAPTATADSIRIGANTEHWFRVPKGASYKVSAVN